MKVHALYIFVALLVGLMMCGCLGSNTIEGLTGETGEYDPSGVRSNEHAVAAAAAQDAEAEAASDSSTKNPLSAVTTAGSSVAAAPSIAPKGPITIPPPGYLPYGYPPGYLPYGYPPNFPVTSGYGTGGVGGYGSAPLARGYSGGALPGVGVQLGAGSGSYGGYGTGGYSTGGYGGDGYGGVVTQLGAGSGSYGGYGGYNGYGGGGGIQFGGGQYGPYEGGLGWGDSILNSGVVPPLPAAVPNPVGSSAPPDKNCGSCPPCARCPEPEYDCQLVPNFNNSSTTPRAVLNNFSTFGA